MLPCPAASCMHAGTWMSVAASWQRHTLRAAPSSSPGESGVVESRVLAAGGLFRAPRPKLPAGHGIVLCMEPRQPTLPSCPCYPSCQDFHRDQGAAALGHKRRCRRRGRQWSRCSQGSRRASLASAPVAATHTFPIRPPPCCTLQASALSSTAASVPWASSTGAATAAAWRTRGRRGGCQRCLSLCPHTSSPA